MAARTPCLMLWWWPRCAALQHLVERLAGVLERQAAASPRLGASGLVINTLGWVEGLGYELQLHAINAFKVTHRPAEHDAKTT